jgi:DNA-binding transcriptional MerR regulator
MQSGLRIGEVAQRAGVSVDTVRYYEKLRLLPRAGRSHGGFRLFTADTIDRVQFIRQAQEIGLSLNDIKDLLIGGSAECRRMRDLLRAKLTDVDERIKAMRRFRRALAHHLSACEEELARRGEDAKCPVIVEISHKATSGGKKQ